MWDSYLRDNINKLLNLGHRVLTVAAFSALTGLEDGDEVYVEVDATNGVMWHFRYVAAETTYKWRFLGGPPLVSMVETNESTASTTYVALATAGPVVALPRAGDYDVSGGRVSGDGNMSYDIGATGAVDADRLLEWRGKRKAGLTSVSLTAKYKANTGTVAFELRALQALPVRVRHDA